MTQAGFKLSGASGVGPVHFASITVNWNDAPTLTAGTSARWVAPAGAHIVGIVATVQTAFNAATTNVLTAGTVSGTATDLIAASDIDESVASTTMMTGFHAGALIVLNSSTDVPIYIKYAQSGTAATAGKATVTFIYALPRNAIAT